MQTKRLRRPGRPYAARKRRAHTSTAFATGARAETRKKNSAPRVATTPRKSDSSTEAPGSCSTRFLHARCEMPPSAASRDRRPASSAADRRCRPFHLDQRKCAAIEAIPCAAAAPATSRSLVDRVRTRAAGKDVESSRLDRVEDGPATSREQLDVDGKRSRHSSNKRSPLCEKISGPLDLETSSVARTLV